MKSRTALTIARTRSAADIRSCARLMASSDPWLTLGLDYKACLRSASAPLREVYAARLNRETAGFIILQMTGTFKGYIQAVCAAPPFRGSGVGSRMIAFAEKRIFSETPNVFLCVSSFNTRARKLYRKLGYEKAGLLRNFIVDGYDELLLRKTRGPLTGRRAGARK